MNWTCLSCGEIWYATQTPADCLSCGNPSIRPTVEPTESEAFELIEAATAPLRDEVERLKADVAKKDDVIDLAGRNFHYQHAEITRLKAEMAEAKADVAALLGLVIRPSALKVVNFYNRIGKCWYITRAEAEAAVLAQARRDYAARIAGTPGYQIELRSKETGA